MADDIGIARDGYVATIEIRRPPNNFFDLHLILAIADAYEALDEDPECRAIVLCSEGRHFCAGAKLSNEAPPTVRIYDDVARIFAVRKPVVAAVQGAAIGGGLGIALSADFRLATPRSYFAANFARLGFHHGMGISVTLPAIVGQQASLDLLYTGRQVSGEDARELRLCDLLVAEEDELRPAAHALATEIAASAPLAVQSIRKTLRGDLADRVRLALEREGGEQARLMATEDFREGVWAIAERRAPRFHGR